MPITHTTRPAEAGEEDGVHFYFAARPETRRVEQQPGRNDPCPCGSGRKYKKCHGQN